MSKSRKIWLLKVKDTFCNHNDIQNDMTVIFNHYRCILSNDNISIELELHANIYQIIIAMIFVTKTLSVHPLRFQKLPNVWQYKRSISL